MGYKEQVRRNSFSLFANGIFRRKEQPVLVQSENRALRVEWRSTW